MSQLIQTELRVLHSSDFILQNIFSLFQRKILQYLTITQKFLFSLMQRGFQVSCFTKILLLHILCALFQATPLLFNHLFLVICRAALLFDSLCYTTNQTKFDPSKILELENKKFFGRPNVFVFRQYQVMESLAVNLGTKMSLFTLESLNFARKY